MKIFASSLLVAIAAATRGANHVCVKNMTGYKMSWYFDNMDRGPNSSPSPVYSQGRKCMDLKDSMPHLYEGDEIQVRVDFKEPEGASIQRVDGTFRYDPTQDGKLIIKCDGDPRAYTICHKEHFKFGSASDEDANEVNQ